MDSAVAVFDGLSLKDRIVVISGAGGQLGSVLARDLESMLDQPVWTSFHVERAFLPHLIANGWRRILMIGSPFVLRPNAKVGNIMYKD